MSYQGPAESSYRSLLSDKSLLQERNQNFLPEAWLEGVVINAFHPVPNHRFLLINMLSPSCPARDLWAGLPTLFSQVTWELTWLTRTATGMRWGEVILAHDLICSKKMVFCGDTGYYSEDTVEGSLRFGPNCAFGVCLLYTEMWCP